MAWVRKMENIRSRAEEIVLLEQDLTVRCMECECHFRYGFSAGLLMIQEAQLELQSRGSNID